MDDDGRDKSMRDWTLDDMRSTARALASATAEAIELSRRMTEDAVRRGDRWSGSRSALQDTRDWLSTYELLAKIRVESLRRQAESDQALARARGGACDTAGAVNGDLDVLAKKARQASDTGPTGASEAERVELPRRSTAASAVREGAEAARESLDRVERMALALEGAGQGGARDAVADAAVRVRAIRDLAAAEDAALARVCAGLGIDVA